MITIVNAVRNFYYDRLASNTSIPSEAMLL
jgi:hypothetical protein